MDVHAGLMGSIRSSGVRYYSFAPCFSRWCFLSLSHFSCLLNLLDDNCCNIARR